MKQVKLSSLHEGAVFRFEDCEHLNIVTNRVPDDRSSGGTLYANDLGESGDKWWDYCDPLVTYLGKGRLVVEITEPLDVKYPWTDQDGNFVREYNWAFASKCSANCRYCFTSKNYQYKVAAGERWWTDEQAVTAWAAIAERWGEGNIYFTGLEPGHELPLVGAVLEHHRGFVQTNLTFDLDECKRHLPADRFSFHPTFHPHLWQFDAERFVEKVEALRAAGYTCAHAALVADPLYVPRLQEYVRVLRDAKMHANVVPVRIAILDGRSFPADYTDEENAAIAEFTRPTLYAADSKFYPLKIAACGAGMHVVTLQLNGDVWRCVQLRGEKEQNFIRDVGIDFNDEPQSCAEKNCRCGHLHRFHITESA